MSFTRTITWSDGSGGGTPLTATRLNTAFQEAGDYATVQATLVLPFAMSGSIFTVTGTMRYRFPVAATLLGVSASIGTAPTGASVIADVNKNGTTIFSTQGNRPTIAAGTNAASETTPNTTSLSAGDYLTIDIDQVGSTVPGSDLVVVVRYRWT
jgi:hypothetical protein